MSFLKDITLRRQTLALAVLRAVLAAFALCLAAAGICQVHAQSTKAELFGRVSDPTGLPAPGAVLELEHAGTGIKHGAVTSGEGSYYFSALPAGAYRLTAAKPGFRMLWREGIDLRVGDRVALDLTLELGEITGSMEVTAAPPLIQSSRGTVSFVAEQRKVVNLPLDGRNFIPLLALSPGVNLPPGSTLPRINGSRPRVSEYIYDGISVLQPEPGQVAYFPIIDAIEEFRVETNTWGPS